jgi:hypothetical protein
MTPVGRVATVTVAVRGPQRPGEVELVLGGQAETYIAYATETLALGAAALVLRDRGDRSVDVAAWDHPPAIDRDER